MGAGQTKANKEMERSDRGWQIILVGQGSRPLRAKHDPDVLAGPDPGRSSSGGFHRSHRVGQSAAMTGTRSYGRSDANTTAKEGIASSPEEAVRVLHAWSIVRLCGHI